MGKNKVSGVPTSQAEFHMLGFANDVMRSATVVLVAVTVRSCNVFSICNSGSGFHKQPTEVCWPAVMVTRESPSAMPDQS